MLRKLLKTPKFWRHLWICLALIALSYIAWNQIEGIIRQEEATKITEKGNHKTEIKQELSEPKLSEPRQPDKPPLTENESDTNRLKNTFEGIDPKHIITSIDDPFTQSILPFVGENNHIVLDRDGNVIVDTDNRIGRPIDQSPQAIKDRLIVSSIFRNIKLIKMNLISLMKNQSNWI